MSEYIVRMQSDMPYEIKAELNAWYINSEPIVRCRDCCCMHDIDGRRVCVRWQFATSPDGFCAWGERRKRETVEVWNQWSADDVTCSEEL